MTKPASHLAFVPAGLLDAQALAVFDDAEASITQPMCFDDGALAVRIISAYQAVRKLTGLRIPENLVRSIHTMR